MVITYSGKSAPTAKVLAEEGGFALNRGPTGDVNWGRASANTSLNPDISNVTNKRRMRELFREHDVPMPKLLDQNSADWQFPCLGRPDIHTKGRGFWKCNNWYDVRKALRGTKRKRAATHFMEWVDAPREYRVHIFKGKSIRISEKAHTAFHEYTTIKPTHNVKHVRAAAKKALEAVGLDFGAVDILANDSQAWVLEVNAAPGLGGSMPRVYSEAFKAYLA